VITKTDTSIIIDEVINVAAHELFAAVADPSRHREMDGSATLRGQVANPVITAVDQIFTMEMFYPSIGEYRTDNLVVEFEQDRRIAWMTSREGQPPAGVRWGWAFESIGRQQTIVTHTYDWSKVTDPAILARVSFPRVSADQLTKSVLNLASIATTH